MCRDTVTEELNEIVTAGMAEDFFSSILSKLVIETAGLTYDQAQIKAWHKAEFQQAATLV